MNTAAKQDSGKVCLFEPSRSDSFYQHAEHVGGGWWLCLSDLTWHNGIEFRIRYLSRSVDPDEAKTRHSSVPWIEGTVTPHKGMRVDSVDLGGRSVEMWEAFARAMSGPLADYARRAVALPAWSHPYTR